MTGRDHLIVILYAIVGGLGGTILVFASWFIIRWVSL